MSEVKDNVRPALRSTLTDAVVAEVAKHIVERMEKEAKSGDSLEFDFKISGGRMITDITGKNTWFKFDCNPGTVLKRTQTAIYPDEEDYGVESDEDFMFVQNFYRRVTDEMQKYESRILPILDREMFGGKGVPMQLKRVTNFEMLPSVPEGEDYSVVVQKSVPKSMFDSGDGRGLAAELLNLHRQTGKSFDALLHEKRASDPNNYKYVTGVYATKGHWDCQVDFLVNYMFDEQKPAAPAGGTSDALQA
jgi:hypothetical protein